MPQPENSFFYDEAVVDSRKACVAGYVIRGAGVVLAGAGAYVAQRFGFNAGEWLGAVLPGLALSVRVGTLLGVERGSASERVNPTLTDRHPGIGLRATTVGVLAANAGGVMVGMAAAVAEQNPHLTFSAAGAVAETIVGGLVMVVGATVAEVEMTDAGRARNLPMRMHRILFGQQGERL
ncbi:MAG TPA: hypothetical protein VGS28_04975 [Candidatus Saccharimonadales bacterium]|nr:hypothetical protein [Candidatus Saccharimonadales bacterium]